jgi:hypothetical protein
MVSPWNVVLKTQFYLLHLDWHQQKVKNPWLLPSLNEFLSKIDSTSWKLTPNHLNLVEGGHSGTNNVTLIGKEISEAVTRCFSFIALYLTKYLDFSVLINLMIKLLMNLRQ